MGFSKYGREILTTALLFSVKERRTCRGNTNRKVWCRGNLYLGEWLRVIHYLG
jgi:hypothetical protein